MWDVFLCEASATGSVDGIASLPLFRNGREMRKMVPLWRKRGIIKRFVWSVYEEEKMRLFCNGMEIRKTLPLWKGKRQNRREVTE